MSIADEIKKETERIATQKRIEDAIKEKEERLTNALKNAGMTANSPEVIMPHPKLRSVILECIPHMNFNCPKFLAKMPNDKTLVRGGVDRVSANAFTCDVTLYSGSGKGAIIIYLWIFSNGTIAFSRNGSYISWEDICKYKVNNRPIDEKIVRECIIRSIASDNVGYSHNTNTTSNSNNTYKKSDGGCYVATAVYGSYNCPQVYVLRRFRDEVLNENKLGKVFVNIYYRFSPHFVKTFGEFRAFNLVLKKPLDRLVSILMKKGFSDKAYKDKSEL